MTPKENIKHKFDVNDIRPGDWFLGCLACGWRQEKNTACPPQCPECRDKLDLFSEPKNDT